MIPTALSAQMGGALNPGVHVNPGATVRGAVERGIPGPDLGTWRSPSGKYTVVASVVGPLQSSADDGAAVLIGAERFFCWSAIDDVRADEQDRRSNSAFGEKRSCSGHHCKDRV